MGRAEWQRVQRQAPDWFRDAKFGLFFHWGPYSVAEFKDEWYSRRMYEKGNICYQHHVETYGSLHDFGYKDFYPMMSDAGFDPAEWAGMVKKSGARYAGPVSEHADNFAMWDSQVNPVNSVNYGPKRDVVGECMEAFRKEGIKTLATFHHQWLWGWFMSTDVEADVYIPGNEKFYGPILPLEANRMRPYIVPDDAFCKNWRDKVAEVIDKYDPDVVYFDSRAIIIKEDYRFDIADYYYNKKQKKDGIITYKWEDFPKGMGVFDIECGRFSGISEEPFQVDDRLEDHPSTWSMVREPRYHDSTYVIRLLSDIVSKNGNLLLNVGPYSDGHFHPEAVRVLEEVGEWLAVNGEAIYGTRPFAVYGEGMEQEAVSTYDAGKLGSQQGTGVAIDRSDFRASEKEYRFTTKGDAIYAIAFGWPSDGEFIIRTLKENGVCTKAVRKVTMLGTGAPLAFTRKGDGLYVKAPGTRPCQSAFVLKIE